MSPPTKQSSSATYAIRRASLNTALNKFLTLDDCDDDDNKVGPRKTTTKLPPPPEIKLEDKKQPKERERGRQRPRRRERKNDGDDTKDGSKKSLFERTKRAASPGALRKRNSSTNGDNKNGTDSKIKNKTDDNGDEGTAVLGGGNEGPPALTSTASKRRPQRSGREKKRPDSSPGRLKKRAQSPGRLRKRPESNPGRLKKRAQSPGRLRKRA